ASPTTSNSPGYLAITSSAWVPIDPVDPKIATFLRIESELWNLQDSQHVKGRKKGHAAEEVRVEAIEHAAVTLDHSAGILDAGISLECGFHQVADLCGHARRQA